MNRLYDWLREAAEQLYGQDAVGQIDLVDRAGIVLQNSQLTSTIFHCFEGVLGESVDPGSVESGWCSDPSAATSVPLDMATLPSSLRSLLDDQCLAFLFELWVVLKRDEPQTAFELLHPEMVADYSPRETRRTTRGGIRGYDLEIVRNWVSKRVTDLQGFRDQVRCGVIRVGETWQLDEEWR